MAQPKFEVIEEDENPSTPDTEVDLRTVIAGLKALPQKVAQAVHSCFALIATASVFALAWIVIGSPNVLQLIGLAGYCLFILATIWLVRRR